jgi:hypothetical protein
MSYLFENKDITNINNVLKSEAKEFDGGWTWSIKSQDSSKPMVFSLYSNIDLGGEIGSMISVQTRHGYYELHGITSIVFFEPDEVIFIRNDKTHLSCLIIGSENSCSLYSNIRLDLIKSDFSELHPAVLLSAMQLSITENSLN